MFARLTSALALVLLVASTGVGDEPVTLKYKFKKGDKLVYVLETKMLMTMSFMGQDIKTDMTQAIDLSWDIQEVDDQGKATVAQKFERLQFVMDNPMLGKMEFDSKEGKKIEGPAALLINSALEAMSGAEMTMTMDAYGKIGDVKISEKLAEAFKKIGEGAGRAGLGATFSEEGIKNMVGQGGLVLPKESITKGKSWNHKHEMKLPFGKMIADIKCTYDGTDDKNQHKVSLVPSVTFDADPNAKFTMKIKSNEGKGTVTFDNNLGRLVSTEMKQTTETEIDAGGQTVPQKMEQTITLKLRP